MAQIPPMTVTFDDGTQVVVEPKARDMVGAEAAGHSFADGGPIRGMYAVALSCLQRMHRAGTLPEGLELPDTLDALVDAADVEAQDEEDPEGND